MFCNQSTELSLHTPLPALEAVQGDRVRSRFWAATASVRASEDNSVHLLSFVGNNDNSGTEGLVLDATMAHPTGPVAHLASAPNDASLLLTVAERQDACTLWKVPSDVMDRDSGSGFDSDGGDNGDYYDDNNGRNHGHGSRVTTMERQATLEVNGVRNGGDNSGNPVVVDLSWRGGLEEESSSFGDVCMLSADGTLTQWDVAFGSAETTRTNTFCRAKVVEDPVCAWNLPPRMAWDPHHADQVAVSVGTKVHLVDFRQNGSEELLSSSSLSSSMSSMASGLPHHRYGITDLDYNPNRPNVLTTSGKDGLLKFWDLRSARQPLLVARGGHGHWISAVSYNPFHDQLVLSAGTDSFVNLWRISTISSAPLLTLDDDETGGGVGGGLEDGSGGGALDGSQDHSTMISEGPNVRVSRHEHMDSVGAIAWGAADAWIYASASYDGKVVLNHVPSKEKYRILL